MILQILATIGVLDLLSPSKKEEIHHYHRENWIDKAGIKWTPEELAKLTKETRIYHFGYDPLN